MVTAKDVATYAGVSVATVSRVLMGAPHVTPEKRQKVLAAVQALDYRPDQVARSLRTRRSNLIALVVSTIENQFFTEVARAAEQAAIRHGYNLVISNTDEKLEREQEYFSILSQQLVAGVILAPAPGDVASRRYLFEPAFPVVLINRILQGAPCPAIVADDAEAAEACVNVLIQEGRRRIGCVTGIAEASTTQRRLRGYEAALDRAGLTSPPELRVSVRRVRAVTEGADGGPGDEEVRARPGRQRLAVVLPGGAAREVARAADRGPQDDPGLGLRRRRHVLTDGLGEQRRGAVIPIPSGGNRCDKVHAP
jgi:DNA-binding LacI/PurR family transcriptional regulator